MLSPLQLVKRTPLSNCGKCGHPTCLAFAVAVLKLGLQPDTCPFINLTGLDYNELQAAADNVQQERKDVEFIAFLKEKIAACDFADLADKLGATYTSSPTPALLVNYLGQETVISKKDITINGKEPADHRDIILLYNYVSSDGVRHPASGQRDNNHVRWQGLESLPNSISKIKTLATYCEDRLARIFDRISPSEFAVAAKQLHGSKPPDNTASLAAVIPVLPMLPQYILFWAAEPEDNFPAKVKVLFDENVMDILDLESLVFSAERMADRIINLVQPL